MMKVEGERGREARARVMDSVAANGGVPYRQGSTR